MDQSTWGNTETMSKSWYKLLQLLLSLLDRLETLSLDTKTLVEEEEVSCVSSESISHSGHRSWYPPGHGDIYNSLKRSGLLDKFLEESKEFIFISNIDNLGTTVDLSERGKGWDGDSWGARAARATVYTWCVCSSPSIYLLQRFLLPLRQTIAPVEYTRL